MGIWTEASFVVGLRFYLDGFRMAFRGFKMTVLALSVDNVVSTKTKFMQMLDTHAYKALEKEAEERGASIQELLRTVIIPDWLMENKRRDRR